MKITPLSAAIAGSPSTNVHGAAEGSNPSRVERAKAIAAGENPIYVTESDTPQERQPDVRRITMKTNATVDRYGNQLQELVSEEAPQSTTSDTSAVPPVVEDTKPLDPQFAALARQRRALQAKERELSDREKALAAQPTSVGAEALVARLKSEPLSVLQEHGVTYDQLTEAILNNQSGINPEIHKLREEIKALKEGVDKTLTEKDTQAEQQVLAEIRRESERLASNGNDFEMVRATQSYPEVVELIHRTYKQTGEILDVTEAMDAVENFLIEDAIKLANTGKIRSRLTPPAPPQQQQPQKQIRTLTNRDTARPVSDRRQRAIAAALGTLKR